MSGAPESYVRQVLVLANETVAGRSLLDAVRARAAEGPIRVTVLAPQNAPRGGLVVRHRGRRHTEEGVKTTIKARTGARFAEHLTT